MVEVSIPEEQQLLLAGYVLGDLTAEESRALGEMLQVDAALQTELDILQGTLESTYGASSTPPARLKEAVLAGFKGSAEETVYSVAPSASLSRGAKLTRQWSWRGLGALAAGLIIALTVQNQSLRQTVATLQTTSIMPPVGETIDVALSAVDAATQPGQVSLVIDPVELNAVLLAEGLQPLAPGEVYVLWTVVAPGVPVTTDEKGAILTAVFTVNEEGRQTQAVELPTGLGSVRDVRAIAVTIEDAEAPQAHRSSPILIELL